MKYKFILFVLLIFVLFSCNVFTEKPEMKKEVIFNTGYAVHPKFCGSYFNKTQSREEIYLADPVSEKCIKLYDTGGKYIDSISLNNAKKYLGEIEGISIVSLDTIIVNSLYTNKLCFIDRKGNCWKFFNLNPKLHQENGDRFEITSSCFSNVLVSGSLLFSCSWRNNTFDQYFDKEPNSQLEYLHYFYGKSFVAPYFFKLSDYYSVMPEVKFGLDGFYRNITESPEIVVEPSFYTFQNNKIFVFSTYSDYLFIIDPATLKIEDKIKISSRYTKVGTASIPITIKTMGNIQNLVNRKAKTAGSINRVYYDENKNQYYLLVYHAVKADSDDLEIGNRNKNFSIIVLDDSFSVLDEHFFSGEQYIGGFSIMTKDGILINTKQQDKKQPQDAIQFSLFDL